MIKNLSLITFTLLVMVLALPSFTMAATLTRQLELGMTGADVGSLQTFLASDPSIYPQGLVTNYFGFLTKAAVANFQSKNGLPPVGRVGPATLPIINWQMVNGMTNGGGSSGSAPIISNVSVNTSRNSATIGWLTNISAKGKVYYSSNPLITYERTNSVDVSGDIAMSDSNYRFAQSVLLPNLSSNTTYYYLIYTTDQQGDVSVTWPASFRTTN